jgi:hypothetical protein
MCEKYSDKNGNKHGDSAQTFGTIKTTNYSDGTHCILAEVSKIHLQGKQVLRHQL